MGVSASFLGLFCQEEEAGRVGAEEERIFEGVVA
jgi:hypothetical protein